jgi:hypothetical protein
MGFTYLDVPAEYENNFEIYNISSSGGVKHETQQPI